MANMAAIYFILVYWQKLSDALGNALVHGMHSHLRSLLNPEGEGLRWMRPDWADLPAGSLIIGTSTSTEGEFSGWPPSAQRYA